MTNEERKVIELALEALENNRQTHNYCEDTWYSCPKHEEGCANESEGDECNCGADEINAQFDKAITAIKEALAQPEQEPVAFEEWLSKQHGDPEEIGFLQALRIAYISGQDSITTPPQRKPLTDEMIVAGGKALAKLHAESCGLDFDDVWKYYAEDHKADAKAVIEAAHGIKE